MVKPGLAHRWMSAMTCPERASAARECSLLALLGARDGWRGWRARVATTEGSEPRRALERGARDGCRVALHQSAGASERRPPGGGPEASGLRSARCARVLSGSAASGPPDQLEGEGRQRRVSAHGRSHTSVDWASWWDGVLGGASMPTHRHELTRELRGGALRTVPANTPKESVEGSAPVQMSVPSWQ